MKQGKSIVREKIKLTSEIAGVGALTAIIGGLISLRPVFIVGLVLVALSPYISLYIMLRKLREQT
ncbi:MAG: hypothetical protein F7C33_01455 [Desulfurococcales archaeon]|nr:hypothetical protein [Desulfurococcales archaeon]